MGKPSKEQSDDDELASPPGATASAASLFDPMRLASAASRAGDAASTAKYLFESRFVDGAVSRIGQDFNHADAEDSVAEAVADVCLAIRSGKKVREPAAYVWVAARRRAIDKAMEHRPVQFEEDEEVNGTDDDGPGRASGTNGPARRSWREAEEDQRDDLRRKGLAVAHTLLPQLGPRVREVMTYILDAIDAGYVHVPHEQIADDLGLTADTVRVATHRGFSALTRLARQLGLHDQAGVGAVIEDVNLTADGDGPEDDEE